MRASPGTPGAGTRSSGSSGAPSRAAGALLLGLCLAAGCAVPVGQHPYSEPHELAAALRQGTVLLIDVRTRAEYAHGHIPGAVNIPHDEIAERLEEIPKDRDIVVYCRSSHRVKTAIEVLGAHGYSVYNFGRIGRWEGDLEKGP